MACNSTVNLIVSPSTLPLYLPFASLPCTFTVMVNETSSPSTLPSSIVDLPEHLLVVSTVSLWPSPLKTKVLSTVPLGVSAVPFQLPLISPAETVKANIAIKHNSHFIGFFLSFLDPYPSVFPADI